MQVEEIKKRLNEGLAEKDFTLLNNDEYSYAIGQVVQTIAMASPEKTRQSVINNYLNAKTDEKIKKTLTNFYQTDGISLHNKIPWLMLAGVLGYKSVTMPLDHNLIIAGFADKIIEEPGTQGIKN